VIGRIPKYGALQVGAPADLSIMDMVEGPVSFVSKVCLGMWRDFGLEVAQFRNR
jgi:cytosine/adenosine deaminase-related metal-dependent hydrolase